ncbi:MAG: NADPH:quinone reductase [Spirochaetes bacterium GWD1_27_9]|nr:MAG: NADPH:quinone reductase [Spirochaetes bacterium GWB1_27_13]OHD27104.1 MAG: NADPH:quinone reductase [Spirochaetes bacterium GWC1_27_15]OHD42865.1 MAG: NADPH:quinone reductase [Spirochaetes bacterium GWD1_27_9]
MKAVFCEKYGTPDVLKLKEIKKPIPKDNEVLIKIYATSVSSGDCRIRRFDSPMWAWLMMRAMLGFTKPRNPILGSFLAGEIESVGKNVKKFKKGDQVYASTGMKFGAYAEYVCLNENSKMTLKPVNASFEEAVSIPFGGTTALYFLRRAGIKKGLKVLIYGASGAIGTSAVQIAKYFGAEVTGVTSTSNLEFVKNLGADKVIDYTKNDYTNNNELFDIIFDSIGKITYSKSKKVLKPDGKYVTVAGFEIADEKLEDFILLKELIEQKKIKPVIDKVYPLEEIVEAHKYVEKGHKKGNVVIRVQNNNKF